MSDGLKLSHQRGRIKPLLVCSLVAHWLLKASFVGPWSKSLSALGTANAAPESGLYSWKIVLVMAGDRALTYLTRPLGMIFSLGAASSRTSIGESQHLVPARQRSCRTMYNNHAQTSHLEQWPFQPSLTRVGYLIPIYRTPALFNMKPPALLNGHDRQIA